MDRKEIETTIAQLRVNQRYCDDSERRELDERIEQLEKELKDDEQIPPPDRGAR